jgi:hypothetical protein
MRPETVKKTDYYRSGVAFPSGQKEQHVLQKERQEEEEEEARCPFRLENIMYKSVLINIFMLLYYTNSLDRIEKK